MPSVLYTSLCLDGSTGSTVKYAVPRQQVCSPSMRGVLVVAVFLLLLAAEGQPPSRNLACGIAIH